MRQKLHERIEILYEDLDLIIIEKATGILTYPVEGERQNESAIRLIRRYWRYQNRPHNQLYLLHRLDKETSGLVVFAKTSLARNSLRRQFEEHTVVRAYLAVTEGVPEKKSGTIKTFLSRNERGKRAVTRSGKVAITRYEVLVTSKTNRALLRCYLHTGRTHQVRIHMAYLHTPIVGDTVYGQRVSGRMALHAEVLGFIHPRTGFPLLLRSSLPPEIRSMLGPPRNRIDFQTGTFR